MEQQEMTAVVNCVAEETSTDESDTAARWIPVALKLAVEESEGDAKSC